MGEIVLSGIRATGRLHLGNLLGAVDFFVKYQTPENTCLYFVADWHTLTTFKDQQMLRSNLLEMVKDWFAAGLNPEQSVIYAQSSVPEIAELTWYLSTLQQLPELSLIPTYKDLIRNSPSEVNLGMYSYPVLMAADILGPKATLVPVGEDQAPNVELSRELARRFNNRFGETFVVPDMMEIMLRVPGLDSAKMSKSAGNAVDINLPMEEVRNLYLRRGVTDPQRTHANTPGDPFNRCQSVYPMHQIVTAGEGDKKQSGPIARACLAGTITCSECKERLISSLTPILEPFQERRRELDSQDEYIREVLHDGGIKARQIIAETVAEVREKMGVIIY